MAHANGHAVTRRALLGGAAAAGVLAGPGTALAGPAARGRQPVDRAAIEAVAARLDGDLVELRRDIHRHPELAGGEGRTAALVAARLRGAGLQVTTGVGGHGVVGVLEGAHGGRTVAYRADMDAVPPGSQINGGTTAAHLCGHDLHTTIGVGVAEVLARLRHRLGGRLVFLFQPGEEALTGARAMIDAGVLERTRPEEIHALHCGPFPVGHFAVTPGTGLPGLDRSVIELTGPDAAGRAGRLAAAIGDLATVRPPSTSAGLERLVAEIQAPDSPLRRFVAIQARPVTAGGGEVQTSSRCWPPERYLEVRGSVRALADRYGGQVSFPTDPFPAMVCPQRPGRAVERYLRDVLGPDKVTVMRAAIPFSGEDFALFLRRLPGTFSLLGVRSPGADIATSYPHFGTFDPDERAIGVGVGAMAGWLAERSRGER